MTRKEQEKLQEVVRLLHSENGGDFERAVRILLPMAGMRKPAYDAIDHAKPIRIEDIPKADSVFRFKDPAG